MTTSNRPPLWEVMRRAYDASPQAPMDTDDDWTDRHGYAAEIRAVRDWLLPEEGQRPDLSHAGTRWEERQRLRSLLTAEADRAERGDHG